MACGPSRIATGQAFSTLTEPSLVPLRLNFFYQFYSHVTGQDVSTLTELLDKKVSRKGTTPVLTWPVARNAMGSGQLYSLLFSEAQLARILVFKQKLTFLKFTVLTLWKLFFYFNFGRMGPIHQCRLEPGNIEKKTITYQFYIAQWLARELATGEVPASNPDKSENL